MVLQHCIDKETGKSFTVDDRERKMIQVELDTSPLLKDAATPPEEVGIKYDDKKPDYALLDFRVLDLVVQVMTFGKFKYGPYNWKHVKGWRWRYFSAGLRHISKWAVGEIKDPETGIHHLAHAIVNLMFLLSLLLDGEEGKEQENGQND